MIRVLIVDEQRMFAQAVGTVLDAEEDITVVGIVHDETDALEVTTALRPDVVLVDALLAGQSGFDTGAALQRLHPEVALVYLTAYVNPDFIHCALDQEAAGYLTKDGDVDDLVRGVRQVAGGGRAFSELPRRMAAAMRRHVDPADTSGERHMSDREREVFRRLADGDSLSATARSMSIDTETVRTLWKRAREKLGLRALPRRLTVRDEH